MAVIVPIAAEFDASGVKAAQASFAQFGQTLTKTLQQAGKDARKSFGDIEEGANTSSTAAQRLAAAITKSANTLDTELKQSKAAADALAKALGPDFVAKAGAGGINKLVVDLNHAGVSINEITTEADQLAAALLKVDAVNLSNATTQSAQLNKNIAQTNTQVSAGQQVFASFSGQATTELANLGGSIGAVASGLGQVVAQSVAGRVSLLEFTKVAGPMLALSVIILEIKSAFNNIKEAKAWKKDEVKAFTDALRDGANVSTAVRDRIDEVGGAFVQVNKKVHALSPNGLFRTIFGVGPPISKEVRDITQDLVDLGLKSSGVAKIVAGGESEIQNYVAALTKAGVSSGRVSVVQQYLEQQLKLTTDAVKAQKVATEFGVNESKFYASSMDTTAIAAGAAAVAVEQKTAADKAAADAAQAAAEADLIQANAIDQVRESLYKRNNARYAAEDADLNAKDAIEAYNKAQAKADKTGKASDIEKANQLRRDAERTINNAAAATSNYASDQMQYASAAAKSAAETAAGVKELKNLQALLDPNSALVGTVEQWILLLNQVPRNVLTKFGISFGSSVTTATPSTSSASSIADTWASNGVFDSLNRPANVTNITVNGATNSQETANLIATNQARSNQRQGLN